MTNSTTDSPSSHSGPAHRYTLSEADHDLLQRIERELRRTRDAMRMRGEAMRTSSVDRLFHELRALRERSAPGAPIA